MDIEFIKDVARDYGLLNLTEQNIKDAHIFANEYPDDYYYRLKEYFANNMKIV